MSSRNLVFAALVLSAVLAFVSVPAIPGQARVSFEAASIKAVPESVDWPPRAGYWVAPVDDSRRFRARVPVSQVIEYAYKVRDFQIAGGPEWVRDVHARYDFQATAESPSSREQLRQMVQTLLAERLHLKIRREIRELPVYTLLPGRNGVKLKAAEDASGEGRFDIGGGQFTGRAGTITALVGIMTENMDRPVIDRTQLTGHYDFTLNYDPSLLPDWRLGPVLPSMMRELGLRLEAEKAPVEMLIIDSIEHPSEN